MVKKTSLRDIAKKADVALSTVSQVLNNKAGVSPHMRQAVLQAANELGYRYKITSESTVSPHISIVGLLTKRYNGEPMIMNEFYSYVLVGAERECARHTIGLMYANIDVDANNHALVMPAMLTDQRVDALIVVGTLLDDMISDMNRRFGQRIVLVDAYTNNPHLCDSVLIDNTNGAITAVNYLIQSGHRHIGLIGSNPDSFPSILERREGYLTALRQQDIPNIYIEEGLLDRTSAYESTLRLLARVPHLTAIFACNDNAAIGVMNAIQSLGKRVPDDISVIGFDDIDLAQEISPSLTTIHVDKVLLGAMALRMLRDRAESPERAVLKTVISTQLITRESVRRLSS